MESVGLLGGSGGLLIRVAPILAEELSFNELSSSKVVSASLESRSSSSSSCILAAFEANLTGTFGVPNIKSFGLQRILLLVVFVVTCELPSSEEDFSQIEACELLN